MIQLRSEAEIANIKKAARIVALVLEDLKGFAKPGCTTKDLETRAVQLIEKENAESAFKGYRGYPGFICTSVNEQIVHGIPGVYRLKEGDIVGIDVGAKLNGYYGDGAITVPMGKVKPIIEKLINATREALNEAIEKAVVGNRIGDISSAIQVRAEKDGFSVVRDYVGHGVGTAVHEEPGIPNFGSPGTGLRLKAGMVLAIETMVNLGDWRVKLLNDGWTAVTADKKPSAHFEHTIAVTDKGPQILTTI
jgi:methionyl aminopeptidase